MQKPNTVRIGRGVGVWHMVACAAFTGLVLGGAAGTWPVAASGQETEALRIDVTLDEYSFSPEPLRIPAGRPVTLVIRNTGKVAHEFMAGRDVEGNDFKQDLFADLHVNIEQAEMADMGHAEHREHVEAAGQVDAAPEHDHGAGAAEQDDRPAEHAHGEGHEHGTMVEAQAGETFLMTFTLPEERRGEWATGCFLPGHYDAGMHGTLIVE